MQKQTILLTTQRLVAALLISAAGMMASCTNTIDPNPAPPAQSTTPGSSTTATPGSSTTATPGSSTTATPGSSTTATPGSTTLVVVPFTDYIAGNAELSLLKAAVARAGIGAALNAGQITIFAPSNEGFKASGYSDEAAINAVSPEMLKQILQYHVISDKIDEPAIPTEVSTSYQTQLANAKVYVFKSSAGVITVNNATVTKANIPASNTVVHIINRVLSPNPQNVVDYAKGNANLSLFSAAVARAGADVQAALTQAPKNGITVFVPTNDAFKAAGYADEAAIKSADAAKLAAILSYHVLPSTVVSQSFKDNSELTTAQGGKIGVKVSGGKVTLTGKGNGTNVSNVTQSDIALANGIVHVVDRVLLPQ
jgi:uncharacterized surface protein with fasciclin (FAS1) repeats